MTSWKEEYKRLDEKDTEVLGISVDHIYSQNVFEASLGTLPYPLLADWHKTTVKKYGVFHDENETAIRSCFLVDKNGIIDFVNTSFQADNKQHYEEIIARCKQR
ncbi:AhpC/TSA family protein [Alteribacillus persepolensis]|uniref:AhpC/TSA family protein n=1 Tax=Alteribacillus persepolensis TaxID=568899 RepID=A0A1G8C1M0_9BACI|nr:AhpC/TSA family protein [Alteribacillus persepolensis]